MASDPKLKAEIGADGLAREAPVIAYTEKVKQIISGCIIRTSVGVILFY